jgi:hypothetical protein
MVTLYHYQCSAIEFASSYEEHQNKLFLPYFYPKTEVFSIFETFWFFWLNVSDNIRNVSDANGTDRRRRRPTEFKYVEDLPQHNVPRFETHSGKM